MIHKNIYSNRINNLEEVDPYNYEITTSSEENSLLMMFAKFEKKDLFESVKDFCETKRIFTSRLLQSHMIHNTSYPIDNVINEIKFLFQEIKYLLDFIDIYIANINNDINDIGDSAFSRMANNHDALLIKKATSIKELNEVFEHNNFGYIIVNDVIATKESDFLHQEVVSKALTLLINEEFQGPTEEFKNAIKTYTNKEYENSIIEACKSFESTIKTILEKLNATYESGTKIPQLIEKLKENGLFDHFLDNMFNQLKSILTTGLPTIRNKKSGHGDGKEKKEVERSYASFALNLAGSSIIFLIDRYYEKTR